MTTSASDTRARAKRIGEDVELLVAQLLDGVELVPDSAAEWYDAVVTADMFPPQDLTVFGGICLLWREAKIEIKACQQTVSNGDATRDGRWLFKGRDDGQHAHLVESNGIYALAVHREADVYLGREVIGLIVIPASTVSDHLEGRWYDSQRREGMVAQLSWSDLLSASDLLDGGPSA